MTAAVILTLGSFAAIIGGLTVIVCGAALLRLRPTRVCPQCESRVLLEARRCRACGYKFTRERGVG